MENSICPNSNQGNELLTRGNHIKKNKKNKVMKYEKKKSSGPDGITQEGLLLGINALAVPLTHVIKIQ